MIDDVFKYRNKKNLPALLAVYKSNNDNQIWSRACWVRKPGPNTFYFDDNSLKRSIEFQLKNTYFKFGNPWEQTMDQSWQMAASIKKSSST